MTTITIGNDGIEFIHTSVMIPRQLRECAKAQGISCSKVLKEALEQKMNLKGEQ